MSGDNDVVCVMWICVVVCAEWLGIRHALLITRGPPPYRGLYPCGLAYTYGGRVGACLIGATALEEVLAKVANFRWVSHVVYCTVRSAGTLYSI